MLQLWHVGRISDPIYLGRSLACCTECVVLVGHVSLVRPMRPFITPRALELSEIPGIVEEFRKGAENAKLAGFDGVEIHGANGYLLDQFLQDSSNHRTDAYGGPIEHRARLMLEVTDAVIGVWGPGRAGLMAPRGDTVSWGRLESGCDFRIRGEGTGRRHIVFLCARESLGEHRLGPQLKAAFGGAYIANEGLNRDLTRL